MRIRSFLPLLIIVFFFNACENNGSGKKKENLAYSYYPDGSIKREAQMKDTLIHGLMKVYTPGGSLKKVFTYDMGKREGPAVEYYSNGKLRLKACFRDNKMTGLTKLYYRSGELYRETQYSKGMVNGYRKQYYKDGKLMSVAHFRNGQVGLGLKEYDSHGKEVQPEPKILVEAVNQLAFNNKYILKIRLSKSQANTVFYIGTLDDGYLNTGAWPLKPKNGIAEYTVYLNRGDFIMKELVISARFETTKSNYGLVSRVYNLAIDNK